MKAYPNYHLPNKYIYADIILVDFVWIVPLMYTVDYWFQSKEGKEDPVTEQQEADEKKWNSYWIKLESQSLMLKTPTNEQCI